MKLPTVPKNWNHKTRPKDWLIGFERKPGGTDGPDSIGFIFTFHFSRTRGVSHSSVEKSDLVSVVAERGTDCCEASCQRPWGTCRAYRNQLRVAHRRDAANRCAVPVDIEHSSTYDRCGVLVALDGAMGDA